MQIKHNSVSQTRNRDIGDTNMLALYLQQEQEATKGKMYIESISTSHKLLIYVPYSNAGNFTTEVTAKYVQTLARGKGDAVEWCACSGVSAIQFFLTHEGTCYFTPKDQKINCVELLQSLWENEELQHNAVLVVEPNGSNFFACQCIQSASTGLLSWARKFRHGIRQPEMMGFFLY